MLVGHSCTFFPARGVEEGACFRKSLLSEGFRKGQPRQGRREAVRPGDPCLAPLVPSALVLRGPHALHLGGPSCGLAAPRVILRRLLGSVGLISLFIIWCRLAHYTIVKYT